MNNERDAIVNEETGITPVIGETENMTNTVDNARKGCPDTEAAMINHLLFHKAIIREPDEKVVDVDTYVGILQELDRGMHVVLDNPVDRAVAIAFQLVIDERFDPWNLDLMEFTKLYLKKIRSETDVNFIIAGRLVMMAWSIMKTQSEQVLVEADRVDEPEDFYFDGWDVDGIYEEPQPQGANFSQLVLDGDVSPITEAVRSNDVRGVTLMSLVEAFDEAREEIALRERIKKFAKKDVVVPIRISDNLHQESLQEDISITWQRICKFNGAPIPITDIWHSDDAYDKVTVFVSTLYLANMNKVKLSQRRFPFGEIMIKNIEGLSEPKPAPEEAIIETEQSVIDGIEAAETTQEAPRDFITAHIEDLAVV